MCRQCEAIQIESRKNMNIQWYPGHMTKAKRQIEQDIRLVDIVAELLDARAPRSTQNPDIRRLSQSKKRLILLNKSDLADDRETAKWIRKFRGEGCEVLALDARKRDTVGLVKQAAARLSAEKRERDRTRGIQQNRPVKALVCGIPNVGKSTFINSLLGKASAKTGNKPGVTKGNQWLTVGGDFLLLDTPGVLWPKFSDEQVGVNLALIGAINDQILQKEELAIRLLSFLRRQYRSLLEARYQLAEAELGEALAAEERSVLGVDEEALAWFSLICRKRGCIKKGGLPDYERGGSLLLEEFRSGRIGKITLEAADE